MHIPEFGIPRENEERRDGGCAVIFDPETQRYGVGERTDDGLYILFGGGSDDNESIEECILREVREESGLHDFSHVEVIAEANTHYHNIAKNVNRVAHATCLLVVLKSRDCIPTMLEAHEKFVLSWYPASDIIQNWEDRNEQEDYSHWIYFLKKGVARAAELGFDHMTGPTA